MGKFEIRLSYVGIILLIIASIFFFYGLFFGKLPEEKTDNKYFIKKIDSLESCIQHYENQAEQERKYRNELYYKKDSLENIIVLYGLYLPSLQELKRTKAP